LRFDRAIARDLIHYGFPFQLQMLANQLSNWATPLLVGTLIGPTAVGYLTWASSNGKKPLMLVDNIMRVAFPHFSRLQADPAEMERIMGRYLAWLLVPAGLWFGVLLTAGGPIVQTIYTAKWSAAVPALILSAAGLFFDVIGWVIATGLNSTGRVHFITRIVLLRSVAHVALCFPLVYLFGYNGVPAALLLASALSIPWIVLALSPGASGRLFAAVRWMLLPLLGSVALGLAMQALALPAPARAFMVGGLVTLLYAAAVWWCAPGWFKAPILARLQPRVA
jgi:O-antigen/teichoic acid export membrane protein